MRCRLLVARLSCLQRLRRLLRAGDVRCTTSTLLPAVLIPVGIVEPAWATLRAFLCCNFSFLIDYRAQGFLVGALVAMRIDRTRVDDKEHFAFFHHSVIFYSAVDQTPADFRRDSMKLALTLASSVAMTVRW